MNKKFLTIMLFLLSSSVSFAAEVTYDYSGKINATYGYTTYNNNYGQDNYQKHKKNNIPLSAEIYTSVGYDFDQDTNILLNLDSQIAENQKVEDYNHGKWGENLYLTLSSAYGEFNLGQIYNAAYQLAVGAPSIGIFKANNSPITNFIANPNWQRDNTITAYRTLNSTYLNTDADAPKVSYTTPEYYNSKLSFSYTPSSYSRAGLINKNSAYDNHYSSAVGLYNYQDIADFEIESSVGYAYNHNNNQEISTGLSIYHKGWTLGGGYRYAYTNSSDYELNLNNDAFSPYYYDGYRRGQAYNVGLSYEFGPLKTGLIYFSSFAKETDNKDKILTWANEVTLYKNLAIYSAIAFAEYEGDEYYTEKDRGYAFMSGIEINF